MKSMKICFLSYVILFSSVVMAFGFNYPNNKKGFSITPAYPSGNSIVQKSGDQYTFEGDVCVIKWGTSWEDHGKIMEKKNVIKLLMKN